MSRHVKMSLRQRSVLNTRDASDRRLTCAAGDGRRRITRRQEGEPMIADLRRGRVDETELIIVDAVQK